MRKVLFFFGWAILIALPVAFTIEIVAIQNLPEVQIWKWAILCGAVVLIFFARNRDEVLKHHVV